MTNSASSCRRRRSTDCVDRKSTTSPDSRCIGSSRCLPCAESTRSPARTDPDILSLVAESQRTGLN